MIDAYAEQVLDIDEALPTSRPTITNKAFMINEELNNSINELEKISKKSDDLANLLD